MGDIGEYFGVVEQSCSRKDCRGDGSRLLVVRSRGGGLEDGVDELAD